MDGVRQHVANLAKIALLGDDAAISNSDIVDERFLHHGFRGLLCVNVSEDRHFESIIICNPLTQTKVELPPLKFRRQPVLLHLLVGSDHTYKVIAAGSAAMGTGNLSRKTEVYDSDTGELKLMFIGFVKTGDSLCLALIDEVTSIMIMGLDPITVL